MRQWKYNRLMYVVLLLFVSLTVLCHYMPRGTGITDSAYYFRDSREYRMEGEPWNDLPYKYKERYFTEQKDRLVAFGAIPGVTGLNEFDCYVQYDENDDISVIRIVWSADINEDGKRPSISLGIWRKEPEHKEGIHRILQTQPEVVTQTEVLDVTVYGLGKPEWQQMYLGAVLPDGSICSVIGHLVSMEQMTEVLAHYLLCGVKYSVFGIDKGDVYETISGMLPDEFIPYIPDYAEAGMEKKGEDYYLTVNGEPGQTSLNFGKQGYNIGWTIYLCPEEGILKNDLGQLEGLTKETLEESLRPEPPYYFGFWVEDTYVYVTLSRRNLVDRVWELMESMEVSQ